MNNAPIKSNELERILRLAEYDFDYSQNQENLDNLTKLAAHIAGTPISQINLIGPNNQWTISHFGLEDKQIARDQSVCQYTIHEVDFFEVPDLATDPRFKDKKYVVDTPKVRYYFGVPLQTSDGFNIGSLCVLDQKGHTFSQSQIEMLQTISNEIISVLEQKKTTRELRLSLGEATERVWKVSHDIRGPISGIIGLSDMIKVESIEIKSDKITELIDLVSKSGRSIIDLADEILTDKKDSSHLKDQSDDRITISEFQHKLTDLYSPQALTKGISLTIRTDIENRNVLFPKAKLLQITGNLISNALKFTHEHGEVTVRISLLGEGQFKNLGITVVDNGIGMKENQIETMLNSDKNRSTEGTIHERGFGFGFQLADHLIKSLDGKIQISSTEGIGTTISVKLLVKSFLN
tara:strand:+ start:11900 stop:13120 length:1221 start_codon:yes stop_codon:yes gene_type:complete